jgi:vacuolar-type H+-ATPase subunit I/STV1
MSEISELIKAIASLLWPIVAFVALFMFKAQIADIVSRLKRGKVLGQELELSDSLEQLHKSASELSNEVASIPSEVVEDTEQPTEEIQSSDETIKNIIHEASKSPKTSLILLATEIEKEARQTLASVGKLKGRRSISISQAISELDSHYGLPRHVSSSLRLFWDTRNKIIHGGEADDRSILSAIDSGVTILKACLVKPIGCIILVSQFIQILNAKMR